MVDNIITLPVCHKCGRVYHGRPALSRADNCTLLCSDCGTREALEWLKLSEEEVDYIIGVVADWRNRNAQAR